MHAGHLLGGTAQSSGRRRSRMPNKSVVKQLSIAEGLARLDEVDGRPQSTRRERAVAALCPRPGWRAAGGMGWLRTAHSCGASFVTMPSPLLNPVFLRFTQAHFLSSPTVTLILTLIHSKAAMCGQGFAPHTFHRIECKTPDLGGASISPPGNCRQSSTHSAFPQPCNVVNIRLLPLAAGHTSAGEPHPRQKFPGSRAQQTLGGVRRQRPRSLETNFVKNMVVCIAKVAFGGYNSSNTSPTTASNRHEWPPATLSWPASMLLHRESYV
eukprot:179460-Chlamydomonas_euryale.AAC.3